MSLFPSETEIYEACRVLFGQQVCLSRDFLFYLQPSGAKSAYRQKAKESHPDLYQGEDPEVLQRQTEIFRELTQAYKLVSSFLREREKHPGHLFRLAPHPHRREESPPRAEPFRDVSSPPPGLPFRVLEIGFYLYHLQVITLRQLAEALVWQRRQRPALGEIARRWGWLDEKGLNRIRTARIPCTRFGEKAIQLGLLTPTQVRTLLFYQQSRQKRLGEYFVERGMISVQDMERYVEELRRHNARVRFGRRDQE